MHVCYDRLVEARSWAARDWYGLASSYSEGALLRIRADGADEVAEQLDAAGTTTELWGGPHL